MSQQTTPAANTPDKDRLLAALSYVWILFVIPIVVGQDKPFVRQHARQGLILFVAEAVLFVIAIIPLLGWIIGFLGWIAAVVISILGIAHSLAGKSYKVPILHKYFSEE